MKFAPTSLTLHVENALLEQNWPPRNEPAEVKKGQDQKLNLVVDEILWGFFASFKHNVLKN